MSAVAWSPSPARLRVAAGTTAGAAVQAAELPRTGPEAIVVVREQDGRLRDLAWTPDVDTDVDAVPAASDDGRSVLRHSAAHVLAQAVQQKFPDAKLGIGPFITDGFYYDFDVERPFTPEDLADLEKRMAKIIKAGQRFARRNYASREQAREELSAEPYKLELIDLKADSADSATASTGRQVDRSTVPTVPTVSTVPTASTAPRSWRSTPPTWPVGLRQPARAHRRPDLE